MVSSVHEAKTHFSRHLAAAAAGGAIILAKAGKPHERSLSAKARKILRNADTHTVLSVVSVWEIVAKYAFGKLPLPETQQRFINKGISEKAIRLFRDSEKQEVFRARKRAQPVAKGHGGTFAEVPKIVEEAV